jgi:hypothetical protein
MIDVLKTQEPAPFRTNAFSIAGNMKAVEGEEAAAMIDRKTGITRFTGTEDVGQTVRLLSQRQSASIFGDTWGSLLDNALEMTETFGDILDATTVTTDFGDDAFSLELKQVARLIKAREVTEAEREVYVVSLGGFDVSLVQVTINLVA